MIKLPSKTRLMAGLLPVFLILIALAVLAIHVFEIPNPVAKTESGSRLSERLFDDLGVLKLPQSTDPIEISLTDIDGKYVSLSDFRGKIVFLNFWTTWCPTCRIEMPSMERLHQKFKDQDFAMVTINLQESASQVKKFFKDFKLTFTALLDTNGEISAGFGLRSIPTTFILDKNGRIFGSVLGPREWDSKEAFAFFEHMTVTPRAPLSLLKEPGRGIFASRDQW